jgi:hypothetical protein
MQTLSFDDRRKIPSSQLVSAPEVSLPELEFDRVFHLFGEQTIPNFMGIRLCSSPVHIPVVTDRTKALAGRVAAALGVPVSSLPQLVVDAYDVSSILRAMGDATGSSGGERIGFNVTGGTKPMFAAALAACHRCNGTAFYVDTYRRTIDFLSPYRELLQMPRVFSSVDEFVALAGQTTACPGRWEDDGSRECRQELTQACWGSRRLLGQHQKEVARHNDKRNWHPFEIERGTSTRTRFLAGLDRSGNAEVLFGDKQFRVSGFPELARYLSGGWLEEHVFRLLSPLHERGTLVDLRIGYCPSWQHDLPNQEAQEAQEFDVAFTDGYTLTVIECKAGRVSQEAIQKLENLVMTYGGPLSRGVLVSAHPLTGSIPTRVSNSRCLGAFSGAAVEQLPERILHIEPGTILKAGRTGRR